MTITITLLRNKEIWIDGDDGPSLVWRDGIMYMIEEEFRWEEFSDKNSFNSLSSSSTEI